MTRTAQHAISPRLVRKAESTEIPMFGLRAVSELRDVLSALEMAHIRSARQKGASWEDIAEAVGVSRQALQQRIRSYETKHGPQQLGENGS